MTADPWALLREARDVCEYPEFIPSSGNISHARQVRARIDAALAGRTEGLTEDVVEWTKGASEDDYAYAQPSSDTYVTATRLDGQWQWSARRVQGCNGTCATEAEAKSAAIAAARRLR